MRASSGRAELAEQRLLGDENLRRELVRGLRLRLPGLDFQTVEELGLRSAPDELVLELAAEAGRIVITHDSNTLVGLAWTRVRRGAVMPGVILVPWRMPAGTAIQLLESLLEQSGRGDFENRVEFL